MALDLYKKKRDFSKTPEPPPRKAKRKKGSMFCVQKHDATRLHYDFRLELDGVLKSWAVTKGPSLDPADKRLAVRTEDHPIEYGDFEGIIPAGQYGGGTVMLWDEGSWEPLEDPRSALKKGHLTFELHGKRMRGKWTLIRMHTKDEKRENWLLIKDKDKESATGSKAQKFLDKNATSVKTGKKMEVIASGRDVKVHQSNKKKQALPEKKKSKEIMLAKKYSHVQLATLVTEPPQGDEWLHEVKYDGYRILCFVENGNVKIVTRNGHDWTERFSSIKNALEKLPVQNAVLDGEAVMLDDNGISGFQALQEAMSDGGNADSIQVYFFDLLHLNNEDYAERPLQERKKALEKILKKEKPPLHYSEHLDGSKTILQRACKMGLEGLISKKKNVAYYPGRSKSWLKSKCNKRQEFIIIGFTKSKSGPRAIGALHLGYHSENELVYAGKVGTGFGHGLAADMLEKLAPLSVTSPPVGKISSLARRGTTWVRPELLCEVSFTEWTKDGHIRHPSFEGLREDKSAVEVKKETPKKVEGLVNKNHKASNDEITVKGIKITHANRLLFEDSNVTKGDLAKYYAKMAPKILKQIKGKPISLLRCPAGAKGECFFQRNPDEYMKKFVKPFVWEHNGKSHEYLYIENAEDLVFLVQMGVIEIHAWGAPAKRIDYPDRLVFDLDPDEGVPFEAVKMAALDVRARLKRLKMKSFVKTSGGKGLHVVVPLSGRKKWAEIKSFAQEFSSDMAAQAPDAYVATMSKSKRKGKIFIDYFRNDYAATAIADYSVRARKGAPISTPITWAGLKKLKSGADFKLKK